VGSLVTLAKSINYLQKKKHDYEVMENQLNSQLQRMLSDHEALEAEVETYETQSY
jgi:prefoldin subunit 5